MHTGCRLCTASSYLSNAPTGHSPGFVFLSMGDEQKPQTTIKTWYYVLLKPCVWKRNKSTVGQTFLDHFSYRLLFHASVTLFSLNSKTTNLEDLWRNGQRTKTGQFCFKNNRSIIKTQRASAKHILTSEMVIKKITVVFANRARFASSCLYECKHSNA